MKKTETVRAGPRFRQILLEGERIEGKFLRCYYLLSDDAGPPMRVGFAVSSRTFNAVQRNRVKRLLREAVTKEKGVVEEVLNATHNNVAAIFLFRASTSVPVERMSLRILQPDVAALCRTLATTLRSAQL